MVLKIQIYKKRSQQTWIQVFITKSWLLGNNVKIVVRDLIMVLI